MAKGQHLSSYQQGIVKRYYKNKDTLATQKLGEIVSELYLEKNPKKLDRLWKSAATALEQAGADKARVDKVVLERDLEGLAELVGKIF